MCFFASSRRGLSGGGSVDCFGEYVLVKVPGVASTARPSAIALSVSKSARAVGKRSLGAGIHVERDAEVEHVSAPRRVDDDVARLEVPVDDAVLVRGGRGASDVGGNGDGRARRERTVGEEAEEIGPFDELHRIVRMLVEREADVEHAHDPRIADARRDERLGPQLVLVARALPFRRVDLHRDTAIEAMLDGLPDDTHAAAADRADQVVAGDDRLGLLEERDCDRGDGEPS
jgi:hypothetical protein